MASFVRSCIHQRCNYATYPTAIAVASAVAAGSFLTRSEFGESQKGLRLYSRCQANSGLRGYCSSGIRYYSARSKQPENSVSRCGIAERLHAFVLADGLGIRDSEAGGASSRCATFCASNLASLAAHFFTEGQVATPLWGQARADGQKLPEKDAAVGLWANSLTQSFGACDVALSEREPSGGCGAIMCLVARSGIYIASLGLGRAVVGTETDNGETYICDEVSIPHTVESEIEQERLSRDKITLPSNRPSTFPTRILGAPRAKANDAVLTAQPDIVRLEHLSEGHRFIILGSPDLWLSGPRLPVEWAVQAFQEGKSPAEELIRRTAREGVDTVALVLVIPSGLDGEDSFLPPHTHPAIQSA
eukprot:TRINITY_DN65004_c0_g1_i1.p1 TRINITY_DN65004_c0_g1~~TRINITY_DN65004_c0_g1_i1.p1  ORF type:complete len:372 (-),score=42.85 TRINITY_DN65004_c0_g1_i1:124-1206(-)